MYYITGDIHGCFDNLKNVYDKFKNEITGEDTLIFLGDYIDRGLYSYEVVEFLIDLSDKHNTIFLKGNHEDMLLKFTTGEDDGLNYFENGGMSTISSYRKHTKGSGIPEKHLSFYSSLLPCYETEDFIVVHAGLNPKINNIEEQEESEMLWIREKFFLSKRKWDKTIIFGHTPCSFMHDKKNEVFFNKKTNIIGIDTGACYNGILSCLRWPDKQVFQG